MDSSVTTSARRVAGAELAEGADVRLSPGGPAEIVNVSETGALVQTRAKLVVGTNVALLIGGSRPQRLAGTVVRSQVSAIHRDSTMTYLLGIAFNEASKPAGLPSTPLDTSAPSEAVAEAARVELEQRQPPPPLANEW